MRKLTDKEIYKLFGKPATLSPEKQAAIWRSIWEVMGK